MKKLLCCFLMLFMVFALAACQSKVEAEYHVSSFDGEKLYIECDGNTLVYERYQPGIGNKIVSFDSSDHYSDFRNTAIRRCM